MRDWVGRFWALRLRALIGGVLLDSSPSLRPGSDRSPNEVDVDESPRHRSMQSWSGKIKLELDRPTGARIFESS